METPNPRYQDHLQHEMAIAYCRSIDLCGEGFDIQAALMVYLFYELLPSLMVGGLPEQRLVLATMNVVTAAIETIPRPMAGPMPTTSLSKGSTVKEFT